MGGSISEANTSLEEGVLIASPPSGEEVGMGTPLGVVTALAPPPKSIDIKPSKKQLPDRVLVSTYVLPRERVHPLMDVVASNLKDVLKFVHHWSPLNQEKSSVTHIRDLFPNYFRLLVAAHSEQYSIPLHVYMDKEDFQLVVDDGVLIRNHNFHRSAELVSADF